jgi:pimeloyl-ACP methyl ester carboxylesterase
VRQIPIVLVPCLLGSARLYTHQIPALWRLGPVTIAEHHRHDTMSAIASALLADAPPHFALVGHSMGGYVAFEALRQAPDRVVRLVLLNTTARPDTEQQTRRRHEHIALAETGRFEELVDILFRLWTPPARRGDSQLRYAVAEMAADIGPAGFVRQQRAVMSRPDSRPALPAIECPTLVVSGADDSQTTPGHAMEIAEAVPAADLALIPRCGHLSTLERPDTVTGIVTDWLAEGTAGSGLRAHNWRHDSQSGNEP